MGKGALLALLPNSFFFTGGELRQGLTFDVLVHPFFSGWRAIFANGKKTGVYELTVKNMELYLKLWGRRISLLAREGDRGLIIVLPNYRSMPCGSFRRAYAEKIVAAAHKKLEPKKQGARKLIVIFDNMHVFPSEATAEGHFRALFETNLSKEIAFGGKIGKVYGEYRDECVVDAKKAFCWFSGQRAAVSPSLVIGRLLDRKTSRRDFKDIALHQRRVEARARRIFTRKTGK